MALKDIQTNRNQLQEYLELIFKVPEKLDKIEIDIKKELLIEIEKRIYSILNTINSRLIACPNETFEFAALNTFQLFNYYELLDLKEKIIDSLKPIEAITKQKDYKDMIWFRTGLKLATGEAYDLYRKYKNEKGHFVKVCEELGFNKTDRPYFSDTINDNNSDKNTFANFDKLKKIHSYLTENNLNFGNEFLEKYNQIGTK